MRLEIKLTDLLESIEEPFEVQGDPTLKIRGFANLAEAQPHDLSFVQSRKYAKTAAETRASVLLVPRNEPMVLPNHLTTISVENPSRVLSQMCSRVEALLFPLEPAGIHPTALLASPLAQDRNISVGAFTTVGAGCQIGKDTWIGARVSIGHGCQMGEGVIIHDNCVIAPHTEIGNHCRIYSGVVIGSPGFGYDFIKEKGLHAPIPQVGRVVLGNYVDVGANTTIDRARIGETRIGDGTKIDNLVQVAHNVKIGRHCILCAYVGISGSVNIGDYVILAGMVGVADHINIASGVQVGGGASVVTHLETPQGKYWGSPAYDYGLAMKTAALQRKIPELFKRVSLLESRLDDA
jgi:UDP-3-O-[3-hydroxymyristoyl] glucosamine N-acyltransferase